MTLSPAAATLEDHINLTTCAQERNRTPRDEQLAILIEVSPHGMMIVDEAGVIRGANRHIETIFGYPQALLVGQSVETLVPDNIHADHGALRSKFIVGESVPGIATRGVFTGCKFDGSDVAIEIFLNPIQTPRGRIVIASLFDVTDQKRLRKAEHEKEMRERVEIEAKNARLDSLSRHLTRARKRAEEANRAKSRFLAGMSHELRTPLNGIMGYAHLLRLEGGLNPIQESRVDAMLAAGKHLLEMIACVLDLSQIEAEHVTLQVVAVDPRMIAAACLDLIRPGTEAKGLALSLAVAPDTPPKMAVDPTRLQQVLLNLLGNAVKFTARGEVKLKLRPLGDGSRIRFEIEDTGPGIPADQRQRLFNDFERLGNEATSQVEGAGLGLAISSRLARLMGGSLDHGDNPSGGSVFWLELPLTNAAIEISEAAPLEPPGQLTRPLNVLVVDDVPMNRDIAASFLRAGGHQVTCAESGAEAISAVATTNFDCVLMDVRMPEMDGLEATRRIRALEGSQGQVPIVAVTAQAFTEQIVECNRAGMDSHLAKPFDPDMLLAAVMLAVGAARRQSHLNRGPVARPTTAPAGLADPIMGSELPVLDPKAFDRTSAFLTPEMVATHLATIATLGQTLWLGLRTRDALTANNSVLVDTAHNLTGSAGMFGFERVASLARQFERAVQSGTADVTILADGLSAAIQATQEELITRTGGTVKGVENALLAATAV